LFFLLIKTQKSCRLSFLPLIKHKPGTHGSRL
jgi:hypothetical protein